jgi:hypothetical protein
MRKKPKGGREGKKSKKHGKAKEIVEKKKNNKKKGNEREKKAKNRKVKSFGFPTYLFKIE